MAGVAVLPTIASSHEVPSIVAEAGPAAPSNKTPSPSTAVAEGGAADIAYLDTPLRAPFDAIRRLFDYLRADPAAAAALNATYPSRGVFKTAAVRDPAADQKLTVDLSPQRLSRVGPELRHQLAPHGFADVIGFFEDLTTRHVDALLAALGASASASASGEGVDLAPLHRARNLNFRLCDYAPETASPGSENGCGAHRDYGTLSVIFQDGTAGLEVEDPARPGAADAWLPVPADRVVVLCGWSAFVLSGGELRAVRHRVRRQPGVRRLSAVLFVAPDLDVPLRPLPSARQAVRFSPAVERGEISVGWFKEFMGKRWRYREGNAQLGDGDEEHVTQDEDIERLILG